MEARRSHEPEVTGSSPVLEIARPLALQNGSFIVVTDFKSSGSFPDERATTPPKLGGSFYTITRRLLNE